jgi:hypothetical protein
VKKFISVSAFPACLHGYGLLRCGRAGGRLHCGPIILRTVGSGDFHFAVNLRTFSDGKPRGGDIPTNFSCRADFHPLASAQSTLHFSADYNLARVDVCRNFTVRSDGDPAVGQMYCALHFAIDVEILAAPYFPLNQQGRCNDSPEGCTTSAVSPATLRITGVSARGADGGACIGVNVAADAGVSAAGAAGFASSGLRHMFSPYRILRNY